MRRWGVLYHSEVLGLYLQKAGWIGLCMTFQQKGQAASLMQKVYQSPLLSESARSFVLNHVGAIVNTYVVTALERHRFHAHRRCVEANELGVKLDKMEEWDMFEEDIPTDDEEREVVNPYHPPRRTKRSPIASRAGGIFRGYQRISPVVNAAGNFGARPRTNTGTAPRPTNTGTKVGGAKQQLPNVQTVPTKNGKQVDVNHNQAFVSSKIPPGAIPLQKPGSSNVAVVQPVSSPVSPPKVQPSTNSWGSPSSMLPGSSAGKTAGLPKSESAPVLNSLKKPDPLLQTPKSSSNNVKTNSNSKTAGSSSQSSGQKTQSSRGNSLQSKPSLQTNPLHRVTYQTTKVHQYLKTKAFLRQREKVIRAYGIKAPRSKISEHKYLRAKQLQLRLYKKRQISNNPLLTPKIKQSNKDSVSGMPDNPQHMESSSKTLSNWLDRHPRFDAFVGGIGNMASNAVAFSISGIVAVAYTKGVWGPKEQAMKKTLEKSNADQPYSLLTDPTTNTTYAVKPENLPKDAVAKKAFEQDQRFQQEILARAAVPVDPEVERRITEVLKQQDKINKIWQMEHDLVEPTPSFVGNEENPTLQQAIDASNYNPHAFKLKLDPMGYQEELEADSTQFLFDNIDKLSDNQKQNVKKGDDLGEELYGMIKLHRRKIRPPPPSSDEVDLALLAGGGNTLWK